MSSNAWDNAVSREFMVKLVKIAEEYENEAELLADLENFGGDVYELLFQTEEINFNGDNNE